MTTLRTTATLLGGAAVAMATLGISNQADAYTYVSTVGSTAGVVTVTDTNPVHGSGVGPFGTAESTLGAYALPDASIPGGGGTPGYGSYATIAGSQWVTGYERTNFAGAKVAGTYASGYNGDFYNFTSGTFNGAPSLTPFTLSGMVLSDNVLTQIQLFQVGNSTALATIMPTGEGTSDQATSYSVPFSFTTSGNFAPDYLVFTVENQNQGSSANLTSDPVSIEYGFNLAPAAVPEPTSVASFGLGGFGLLGLLLRARKARKIA